MSVKQKQLEKAQESRDRDILHVQEELMRQKDETLRSIKAHARNQVDQMASDIRNDREEEFLQEKERLRLEKDMACRQRKEVGYQELDIQMQRLRQKHQCEIQGQRERGQLYHKMDLDQLKLDYDNQIQRYKQQLLVNLQKEGDSSPDNQQTMKDIQALIQTLEKKQDDFKTLQTSKMKNEIKDEKAKIEAKKHQLTQSLRADYKNKYQLEELKADASIADTA